MGLTQKKVRDAKAEAKRYTLRDDDPQGLGLMVTPKGSKSWTLDYIAPDGRKRRWTIGGVDAFDLEQARGAAREALRKLALDGTDPLTVKATRREAETVNDLCDDFLQDYAPARVKLGKLRDTTLREYSGQIRRYIRPAMGKLAVKEVTARDVTKMVSPLPGVTRNRVLALTSRLFRLAEDWELRPQHSNPARAVDRADEVERHRILTEAELGKLGAALSDLDGAAGVNPFGLAAIRVAALSGLRIGEILAIRWDKLDLKTGRLEMPVTKSGERVHTLPSPALVVIDGLPRVGPFTFAGRTDAKGLDYQSVQKLWTRACKAAGIQGAKLHDLRRTAMTGAARSGASVPLLQDLLGHKTSAMALRYVKMAGEEADKLRAQIGGETALAMGLTAKRASDG